ncbi:MAG: hypothetical protein ACOCUV_02410 [bacterium]
MHFFKEILGGLIEEVLTPIGSMPTSIYDVRYLKPKSLNGLGITSQNNDFDNDGIDDSVDYICNGCGPEEQNVYSVLVQDDLITWGILDEEQTTLIQHFLNNEITDVDKASEATYILQDNFHSTSEIEKENSDE